MFAFIIMDKKRTGITNNKKLHIKKIQRKQNYKPKINYSTVQINKAIVHVQLMEHAYIYMYWNIYFLVLHIV